MKSKFTNKQRAQIYQKIVNYYLIDKSGNDRIPGCSWLHDQLNIPFTEMSAMIKQVERHFPEFLLFKPEYSSMDEFGKWWPIFKPGHYQRIMAFLFCIEITLNPIYKDE